MKRDWVWFLLTFVFLCGGLHAQTFSLITGREPVAALDGLWRFHTGDNPQWANPVFDDSQWPLLRSNQDWGKQGYKGYSGMAWYRFAVQVPKGNAPFSLLLPYFITSYQVFADGTQIGRCGGMPPHPVPYYCVPTVMELPTSSSAGPRTIVVAIRVWHWPAWASYYGGGPHGTSYAGAPDLIQNHFKEWFDGRTLSFLQYYFLVLLASLGALVSFALFLFRRGDREYLWFGCMLLLEAAETAWEKYGRFHAVGIVGYATLDQFLTSAGWFAAIAFYYVLLRGRRSWLYYAALAGASLYLLQNLSFFLSSVHDRVNIGIFNSVQVFLLVPPVLWIFVLLLQRARQRLVDARLLLVPVVLLYGNLLTGELVFATFQLGWQQRYAIEAFPVLSRPFTLTSDVLTNFIFLVAMVGILVNRFARTRREEERYASELAAGHDMQSLLIPVEPPRPPGFAVESIYLPASEVGGDFFQFHAGEDGSLLTVIGDVSGKGLRAAMTVSTIVGALRNEASRQPMQVLASLNRVLYGQINGFVTCCVSLIEPDGRLTIANAGHLFPYRNGEEIATAGSLPLGMLDSAEFEQTHLTLRPGDRLTLMTDGVLEAQNDKRELFGFERIHEMLQRPITAAELAQAAGDYGQEDDITVLSIEFAGAAREAVPA